MMEKGRGYIDVAPDALVACLSHLPRTFMIIGSDRSEHSGFVRLVLQSDEIAEGAFICMTMEIEDVGSIRTARMRRVVTDADFDRVAREIIAAYPVVNAALRRYEGSGMIIDRITYGTGSFPTTLGGVRYVGIETRLSDGKVCLVVHEKGALRARHIEIAGLKTIAIAGVEHRFDKADDVQAREDQVRTLLDAA